MIRSLMRNLDAPLLIGALVLASIGLTSLRVTTQNDPASPLFIKQCIWVGLGLLVCLAMLLLDYHSLIDRAFVFYGLAMGLLVLVLLFGTEINGSRSWIRFGGVGFQPSELAKLALVLAVARYLSELGGNYLNRKQILILAGFTLVPVLLVIMQGDLGTALTFVPIVTGAMIVAGLRARILVGVLVLVLCTAPIAWFTLKDYQKQRILVTFNPSLDPHGVGYQTQQSLIAIGSGGFAGKSETEGLQSQLGFVPYIHSDFIFALLAEQRGLIGAGFVLLLYLFGLQRMVRIGENARDRSGILIVTGIASLLCFHIAVNVGMTMGLMPAIGIPLPLLSYGGSATIVTFLGLGLVLNIHHRRFVHST